MTSDHSTLYAIIAAVVGIVFIVAFVSYMIISTHGSQEKTFKIVTVGPLWQTDSWFCTSNEDFMVHGALRGMQGSTIAINISEMGTQSLYSLSAGQMQTFSVGSPAGHTIIITRNGTVTGWITMQTGYNANATCTQV